MNTHTVTSRTSRAAVGEVRMRPSIAISLGAAPPGTAPLAYTARSANPGGSQYVGRVQYSHAHRQQPDRRFHGADGHRLDVAGPESGLSRRIHGRRSALDRVWRPAADRRCGPARVEQHASVQGLIRPHLDYAMLE